MKDRIYYEKYGLLFYESEQWELDIYGFDPCGLGDCITNTMREDIKTGEIIHLQTCSDLLIAGKRWPDSGIEGFDNLIARNRIDWEWSKLRRWFIRMFIDKSYMECKFRPQYGPTRDPYCWYYSACILADPDKIYKDFIKVVKVKWWLHTSLTFWAWVQFIKFGRCGKLYVWLESRGNNKHGYVQRMKAIRMRAFNKIKLNK